MVNLSFSILLSLSHDKYSIEICWNFSSSDDDSDLDPNYNPVEESSSDTDYENENITTNEIKNLTPKENVDPIGLITLFFFVFH